MPGPEHPSSPDYVPGPEHPPSPIEIPYVPEPEYAPNEVEVLWGVMEWCRVGRVVVGDTQLRPTLLLYRFIDPFPQLGDTEEFETDESARYT
ncbi:hypothetical protein Tco_0953496 [Tanacetum coccineum]|uniref:Uncharacterized protein n=1 Tax=Tanacetum coccineum TaxID=301880 RepID=A0ABQ5E020_9ASTR